MDIQKILIGEGPDLDSLQMSVRAILVFLLALLMLRVAGLRTLGKKSAFDSVVIIMLGAILSRAIVGSSPFIPTVLSSFVLVIVHRLLGMLNFKSKWISKQVNGERTCLYKFPEKLDQNMKKVQISTDDVSEEIRIQLNQDSLEAIEEVWLERNGQISIVKRPVN